MEWPVFSEAHDPLTDELVDGIEKVLRFTLPRDYVECVSSAETAGHVEAELAA
ncbi:hypothetical protein [Pseudomonas sp. CF161]|uniref:hypothetical protein n=1 Tax=Pseudomonas sp. CF161 TaxID=911241 RepID=UPI00035517F6|nr:hypothetical protein [Pseudomonas sp. CF161]EPL14448.1 hypothetical protein CF161_08346 [Pseudomonas sp. CF161]